MGNMLRLVVWVLWVAWDQFSCVICLLSVILVQWSRVIHSEIVKKLSADLHPKKLNKISTKCTSRKNSYLFITGLFFSLYWVLPVGSRYDFNQCAQCALHRLICTARCAPAQCAPAQCAHPHCAPHMFSRKWKCSLSLSLFPNGVVSRDRPISL